MSKRDLGREGEGAFSGWCNNAGFSCNPSANDKYGWDFIVEFPTERSGSSPIDSLPSPIECKVQVKSTEGKSKGVQIKISALYRLVKYNNPSFVCFIEYGPGHHPEAAYLIHFDKNLIEKILKRVRELESQGKADLLHKSKMIIKYTEEDRIANLSGNGIKIKIEEFVSEGMNAYVADKNKILQSIGKPGFKLKTTFDESEIQNLIDVSIGLKEKVNILDIKAFSSRFSIDLPDVDKNSSNGAVLSMPGLEPTCIHKIVFKDGEYTSGIEFDAHVYISPIPNQASNTFKKIRITSDISEIIILDEKNTIVNFKFNIHENIELSFLRKQLSVIEIIINKSILYYGLKTNKKTIHFGSLNTRASTIQLPNIIFTALNKVIKICEFFNVNCDEILTNATSLVDNIKDIDKLHTLIETRSTDLNIKSKKDTPASIPDKYALIAMAITVVGDHIFGLLISCQFLKNEAGNIIPKKEVYKKYYGPYNTLKNVPFDDEIKTYEDLLKSEGFYVEHFSLG
jgi:hypothetical protein